MFSRLFSFFLTCFSRSRRFRWTREFGNNRKTNNVCWTQIDYPMRLSFLHVTDRKRNDTISTRDTLNHSNKLFGSLVTRHITVGLIVLFTQELTSKYPRYVSFVHILFIRSHHQSSMIVPTSNYRRRNCSRKFLFKSTPEIALYWASQSFTRVPSLYVKSDHAIVEIEPREIIV